MNEKQEAKKPRYFEEALADFVHDAASGGAIRHLVDSGFSTDQIMERLDFPTPRARVEKTVYRYMTETGILRAELPVPQESLRRIVLTDADSARISALLWERLDRDGAEQAYLACPFGTAEVREGLDCLTSREREYIRGVPWESRMMYHRLTGRMLEIGIQLAACCGERFPFYFLQSKEIIVNRKSKGRK